MADRRIALAFITALAVSTLTGSGRPPRSPDVYRFDFGPSTTAAEGYISLDHRYTDPRFLWKGKLSVRDRGGSDLVIRDFVTGSRGEFILGLDDGQYELRFVFGDRHYTHGPVDVYVNDELVLRNVTTRSGEFITRRLAAGVKGQRLRVRFEPVLESSSFALPSLNVRGPAQQETHRVVEEEPSSTIPTLQELEASPPLTPQDALREYCEWLLREQQPNGLFSTRSTAWYQAAYPARTLLAGYAIFGDHRYLEAVTRLLDRFIGEQLPNGAWTPDSKGTPVAMRTRSEIEEAMSGTTNTADIGTIVTCLAVASRYVDESRRREYIAAHRYYADAYAIQFQLASGAFTNGRWQGQDMTTAYSVATGAQGMSFAALHAVTRDENYLRIAERATWFLLENWLENGQPIHHHHSTDESHPVPITNFGNSFYYHEAILWVWHRTTDESLRARIREVYRWNIHGTSGLLQARSHGVWWPTAANWGNSKAGGMPLVLIEYGRSMEQDREVDEAIRRSSLFLSQREFARRIGITTVPETPWGEYAAAATGFAGLTLAELVAPGVIYMRAELPAPVRRAPRWNRRPWPHTPRP